MTRESAKKHFWTDTEEFGESVAKRFGNINYEKIFTGYYIGSEIDKFIDKIYDYFETRTCENCINDYQCDIQDRLELEDYSLNFGCTFFREKENKK